MKTSISSRRFCAMLGLIAVLALPAFGQIAMTQTTLSVAAAERATVVNVANATGIAEAGNLIDGSLGPPSGAGAIILYVDQEAMRVVSIRGTSVTVSRGYAGTTAGAHASGATVWVGPADRFGLKNPAGPCTVTSSTVLPRVVIPTGKVYDCYGGRWAAAGDALGGTATFTAAQVGAGTCAAAITATVSRLPATAVVAVSLNAAPDAETVKGIVWYGYPTANTVNIRVCNPTAGAITPAADLVFNWVAALR